MVHHAGDPVKPEAIEFVLVEPPPAVGEQKPENLPVPVVEEPAVPHPVVPLGPGVKVLAIGPVKEVDPVVGVARRVRVDDVDQHKQSQPVRLVDHRLELLRGSRPRGHAEKVCDVVAKTPVVGMLLDGHDLDGVVTQVPDPWQHVVLELKIGIDLRLLAGHAHVALVDPQVARLLGPVVLELVLLVLLEDARLALSFRLPVTPVELHLVPSLGRPLDPSGDPLAPLSALRLQPALHPRPVLNRALSLVVVGKEELPHAKRVFERPVLRFRVPIIEVPDEGQSLCGRSPLPVPDPLLALVLSSVEPEVLVTLGEGFEAALVLVDGVPHAAVPPVPLLDVVRVGPQRWVEPEALRAVALRNPWLPVALLHGVALRLDLGRGPGAPHGLSHRPLGPAAALLGGGRLEGNARGVELLLELRHGVIRRLDRLPQQLVLLLQHLQRRDLGLLRLGPARRTTLPPVRDPGA
mmetsp:Transcript_2946/g.7968  ORF Transcript_2946/g.7968 Transcript_2946/m.7968 type:complete len:464 (-) Transcript_2946:316-1707(-)